MTYNEFHAYLGQKYPARWRLRAQLRDLLKNSNDCAIWTLGRRKYCGFKAMRQTRPGAQAIERLHRLLERPSSLAVSGGSLASDCDLEPVIAAVFTSIEAPIGFEQLLTLLSRVPGVERSEPPAGWPRHAPQAWPGNLGPRSPRLRRNLGISPGIAWHR